MGFRPDAAQPRPGAGALPGNDHARPRRYPRRTPCRGGTPLDPTIIAAIIAAGASVAVALIGARHRAKRPPRERATIHRLPSSYGPLERRVRLDPRVQRLLRNENWRPTAEAALRFAAEGTEPPTKGWRETSTWEQVLSVWNELGEETADDERMAA